ncbi:MAG: family 16 glycoside hydrolase [Planctomycetota bacterium]
MHPALALVAVLAQAPEPIPVLIVSGANNHDWEWTTPSLVSILDEAERFDVSVTYDPATDLADRARLDEVAAVVLDYNGERWGDAAEQTFLAAVRDGLGVVVVHAANNHGPGWEEYERLVGDLWRKGTGHGRFHPFDVEVVDRDHPVTRTLPTVLMHPDELYHDLVNVHGVERRVLATAFSSKESGGTGENEPMILVKSHGQGRIFHTPLGHTWRNVPASQASHRDPQFRGIVVRGTEWAATGTVRDAAKAQPTGSESLMSRSLWQAHDGGDVPEAWRFDDDVIVRTGAAGDIVTKALYEDFELTFEWKCAVAGNSGIKYRVPRGSNPPIGPEYQILDPASDVANPKHRAGALYDVMPTQETPHVPWGEFHSARIVVQGSRIEHWLDGVLVVEVDTTTPEWSEAVEDSKFAKVAGFAAARPGHILLQDHGDEVWIRGLAIRALDGDGLEPLFSGEDLAGWSRVGDALYGLDGDVLAGSAGPKRKQSFLVSDEVFGDFTLEVDVKIVTEGNSGIQLRSHVGDDGRLRGYQAEIDPSERAWSAGIYDEGRRGWLNDLSDNEAARRAFDLDGWNRYRIVCEGPRIRTYLNGVPAADLLDGVDLTGSLAFQVHGGDDDIVIHWRDPRVLRRTEHAWEPTDLGAQTFAFDGSPGMRAEVKSSTLEIRFVDANGTSLRSLPITEDERWSDDAFNRLTILRAADRFVVQIGDRTAHDLEIPGAVGANLVEPEGTPSIRAQWACLPAGR